MQCLMPRLPDANLLDLQLIFVFYFALDHQNPMLQEEVPIDLELEKGKILLRFDNCELLE